MIKRILNTNSITGFKDMELEFNNARKFEERICFCRDVIDLFTWQEEYADNYKTVIGEALNNLKKFEECDNWFESWLKEEPDNPNCINIYMLCLIDRSDMEKAKKINESTLFGVDEDKAEVFDQMFKPKEKVSGLPTQASFSELVAMNKPRK